MPAPHSLLAMQRLTHERKTREEDELQLLNGGTYRSCKVVGVAVVGVPLHRADVPLALPGDFPVTLVGGIQVDNVEETAAARHRHKGAALHRADLNTPSSHGAHNLVSRGTRTKREAFHETSENTIPENVTFDYILQN